MPVCWAGWVLGRHAGLTLSILSAAVWLTDDLLHGYAYPQGAIPYWNALMLLVFFLLVVWLLTAFHGAHENLEEMVAQRTAALNSEIAERKRLEAAKIQAERMATVGLMAAEVAHEVRNPLGAIVLNLDLIQKEILALAETSGHRAGGGWRAGSGDARRSPAHSACSGRLPAICEDAQAPDRTRGIAKTAGEETGIHARNIGRAGITLQTSFDPSLKTLNADPEQLWQAILNLIRNGIEAMPDGGQLIVSTWREGGEARIRVADTGAGMTADQVEQVFVSFISSKANGTGLGLALVQQIIVAHGGRVECEGAPGEGCTFTLYLPISGDSRPQIRPAARSQCS